MTLREDFELQGTKDERFTSIHQVIAFKLGAEYGFLKAVELLRVNGKGYAIADPQVIAKWLESKLDEE